MEEDNAQQRKFKKMTETPVEPLICRMAVPTIISMLITSIYNMADTFFVGRIGTSATAAVGIVFSLMAIIQAIGFFFGQGSGNYISRKLGAREVEEASRMAATGFFSALLTGAAVMVLGFCFSESFCRLLGATETIMPYAQDYMRLILIGAPYMTAALVLNNQLRLQGNAFYAMIGLVSGGLLNIALDPLFIFGFGLGISGAALATILSQLVSFFLLLLGCNRAAGNLPIRFRHFSPSLARYRAIVNGGLPSLCRQGLASVATICLNTAAGPFGDAAIAAMSIVTRLTQFAASAVLGFGQGFQPVCGFNYGARRYDRTPGFLVLCGGGLGGAGGAFQPWRDFCPRAYFTLQGGRRTGHRHRCKGSAPAVHYLSTSGMGDAVQHAAPEYRKGHTGQHPLSGPPGVVFPAADSASANGAGVAGGSDQPAHRRCPDLCHRHSACPADTAVSAQGRDARG